MDFCDDFCSVYRCNNNVEFFHDIERFSVDAAGGVEPDGDERVGRRVHVLHLRLAAGVRVRQLRGPQAAAAQRRLPARREPGHPGECPLFDAQLLSFS